ncbi:hypothetical protein M8J76_012465 [Diaphorina citri]|nr:hypothetical protein M8J76_012465 [Diaphorina citri]
MASVPIGGAGPPIDAGMPAPMNPVVTQETVNMNSSDGQATDVRKKVLYDEKGTYKTFKVIAQSLKNSKARFLSLHLLGKKLKEVTNEAIQVVNKERLSRDKVLIICANAQSANALVMSKDNRDEPLEVYVPPPLPYKPAVVNNTNKNSRNVRSNKRRDSSHFELPKDSTSTKKLRNSEEKIKDNHVAEMFYKRCAERKMENQALARQAEADVDWVISSLSGEVGANQVQVHPYAVCQSPMSDESFDDLFYPNQDTRAMNIQLNDQNLGQGFPDDPMSPDLS